LTNLRELNSVTLFIETLGKMFKLFQSISKKDKIDMTCNIKTIICIILMSSLFSTVSLTQQAKDIAKELFESTVLISTEDGNSQPLAFGSGFIIKDGFIVTNYHVIQGAYSGYVKLVNKKPKYEILGVVYVNENSDLAVLSVPDIKGKSVKIQDQLPEVGELIYAIGNPRGLKGTFSQGIVSGIRTLDESSNSKLIQITAPISPGSSGGPVVNERGLVVGVAVATFKGGQNLNFCIPSSFLPLITGNEISKPLTKVPKKEIGLFRSLESGSQQDAVIGADFRWDGTPNMTLWNVGKFSYSLRNVSRTNLRNVYGLIIFYGSNREVIDINPIEYEQIIPAGLARRVTGIVDPSIKKLTTRTSPENQYMADDTPFTPIEFRILYFELIDE